MFGKHKCAHTHPPCLPHTRTCVGHCGSQVSEHERRAHTQARQHHQPRRAADCVLGVVDLHSMCVCVSTCVQGCAWVCMCGYHMRGHVRMDVGVWACAADVEDVGALRREDVCASHVGKAALGRAPRINARIHPSTHPPTHSDSHSAIHRPIHSTHLHRTLRLPCDCAVLWIAAQSLCVVSKPTVRVCAQGMPAAHTCQHLCLVLVQRCFAYTAVCIYGCLHTRTCTRTESRQRSRHKRQKGNEQSICVCSRSGG